LSILKTIAWVLAACSLLILPAIAKDKDKAKPASEDAVDSGSFGLFSGGHRVATETFAIKQGPDGSVVSSTFKSAQGELQAEQSSELQLTPSADLRSYQWKETSPEKTEARVTANGDFLVERFTTGSDNKPHEQNFLLPASTVILDDYFFVQREVLAWKYLATACKKDKGALQCPMKQEVQLGTLNPHARSSMSVSIEFTGRDKLMFRGTDHEFTKFILKSEVGDWTFWLDDQFKLVRLLDDSGAEVVRD
jgi:hypothetical protein